MLIAIEGVDGSGKGTQTDLLVKNLLALGKTVKKYSFPRYKETIFGRLVGRYLNGEFGELDNVSPWLAGLLYAGDRFESKAQLIKDIETHDFVICDRYVHSNIAHQVPKVGLDRREDLEIFLKYLEFSVNGMPKPDIVIHLSVGLEVAIKLIARKAARNYTTLKADIHEADHNYLRDVIECYSELAEYDPSWLTIDCLSEVGTLRWMTSIADEIVQSIVRFIETRKLVELSTSDKLSDLEDIAKMIKDVHEFGNLDSKDLGKKVSGARLGVYDVHSNLIAFIEDTPVNRMICEAQLQEVGKPLPLDRRTPMRGANTVGSERWDADIFPMTAKLEDLLKDAKVCVRLGCECSYMFVFQSEW